jgi:hypothetical protein
MARRVVTSVQVCEVRCSSLRRPPVTATLSMGIPLQVIDQKIVRVIGRSMGRISEAATSGHDGLGRLGRTWQES